MEGGLIGGLVLGGGLGFLAGILYDPDSGGAATTRGSSILSASLIGGLAGFIIGALVGGQVPKSATP